MGNNPYGNLGGMDLGGAVQNQSGIPADFTSAAQALGFMPDPNQSPAQQMAAATNFLSFMKNLNDKTLGGSGAAWNQLSPGNPVQAMPLYMRNMYNAYSALANSPAGAQLLPNGSQEMFGHGGYQRGGLGNNMSRMLQTYLYGLNPTQQPGPNDVIKAAGGVGGIGTPTTGTGGGPGGGPNAGPGNATNGASPMQDMQGSSGTPGPTVPVLSGLNDFARNIPGIGAIISGNQNAMGDLLGRSNTAGGPATGGGIPVASGLNDIARGLVPGVGGIEDAVGNMMGRGTPGPGQDSGQAPGQSPSATFNTSGTSAPRSLGLLLQKLGMSSVPQGVDPNAFVDNALFQILGGR